jgi:hypothetical protein
MRQPITVTDILAEIQIENIMNNNGSFSSCINQISYEKEQYAVSGISSQYTAMLLPFSSQDKALLLPFSSQYTALLLPFSSQ